MQPRSLPTRRYTLMRCYITNSYIGKSVHLLLRQTMYLGCTTNWRSIPFEYLLQLLVLGNQVPLLCFWSLLVSNGDVERLQTLDQAPSYMKNLMVQETRSGDATMIDVETLLEGFLNLSPKICPTCSSIRVSRFSASRLKEFYSIRYGSDNFGVSISNIAPTRFYFCF